MLRWLAGLSYMCTLAAGHTINGAVQAHAVVVSKSSQMPLAILAITLTVAGAIRNKSASSARLM